MGDEFDPDEMDEIDGIGERDSSVAAAAPGSRLPAVPTRTAGDGAPAATAGASRDRGSEPIGGGRRPAEAGGDRAEETVPSDAELTSAGLVKRRPGAAFGGNPAASAAEQGAFRRLPTPMGGDDPDRAIAQRRLRVLSELRAGIGRGRDTDVDGVDAAPDGAGGHGPDIDLTDGGANRGTP
jgi:hypothetical protein